MYVACGLAPVPDRSHGVDGRKELLPLQHVEPAPPQVPRVEHRDERGRATRLPRGACERDDRVTSTARAARRQWELTVDDFLRVLAETHGAWINRDVLDGVEFVERSRVGMAKRLSGSAWE